MYASLHGVISPNSEILNNNTFESGWPWYPVNLSFIYFSTMYLAVPVPSFVQLVANVYLTQWMVLWSSRFVKYNNIQHRFNTYSHP